MKDINCPKCGNRNVILPPHKCISWEVSPAKPDQHEKFVQENIMDVSDQPRPEEWIEFHTQTFLRSDYSQQMPIAEASVRQISRYFCNQLRKEYERGYYEGEKNEFQNLSENMSDAYRDGRTDTLNEIEKIVEENIESLEGHPIFSSARVLELKDLLHRIQKLKG